MPKRNQQYSYERTKALQELREEARVTTDDMAEFFGVGRDTARDWELGYRAPHKNRRSTLIVYFLDKLLLRRSKERLKQVWKDVVVEEWQWQPFTQEELWNYLHEGKQDVSPAKPFTPPFLAPPLPPYTLVGRDILLNDLKKRLLAGGTLALSALNGLPGVGKTALAVALAHDREVLEHFSDGVLWAGLGRHADAFALLGTWARALAIAPEEIAKLTTATARAKEIHAEIGMRRMLLVVVTCPQSFIQSE
jgi:DNA-binding XRE family transcriptional regulator